MADVITCPHCHRRLNLPELHRGQKVRCPSCHTQFLSGAEAETEIPCVIPVDIPLVQLAPVEKKRACSSRWPVVLALVVLGGIFAAGIGGAFLVGAQRQGTRRSAEDDAALRQDMIAAFRDQRPLAEDEIALELQPLFTDLGEALRAADGARSVGHFDLDRLFDELLALELLPPAVRNERRQFVRSAGDGLATSLRQQAPLMAWKTFEIRNVKKLQNNEAVVIVRHKTSEGTALKLRWWLSKRSGAWKIFDFEDLDVGCRSSTTMGAVMKLGLGRVEAVARASKSVREALLILHTQHDADAAERRLQQDANIALPPNIEALRKFVRGLIQMERGQTREALATFDEATVLNPDMPFLDFMKGAAHNQLGEFERALTHLNAYRALLGEDAAISYQLGLALAGLHRSKEALASFRRALDDEPKFGEAFDALVETLLPGDANDDLRERFARLDEPRTHFDALAEHCRGARSVESLTELCAAMRGKEPAYPPVAFYESLLAAWDERGDEAVAHFQKALAAQGDAPRRAGYVRGFGEAMVSVGEAVKAYNAAPDQDEAFRILAAECVKHYRIQSLRDLVLHHGKRHPDDPYLRLYEAEVYVHQERFALADELFSEAAQRLKEGAELQSLHASRVRARYHANRALSALAELEPREDTFRQLAELCLEDRDYLLLDVLLDAHVEQDPARLTALYYRWRMKLDQQRPREAVSLFKEALAAAKTDEMRKSLTTDFLQTMAGAGYLVEAYEAAANARGAFALLTNDAYSARAEELRPLVDAHRQRDSDDPRLSLAQGDLLYLEKAWDKADAAFKTALEKAPEDLRARYRWKHLHARMMAGRSLEAYRDATDRNMVFGQLANLLVQQKKGVELEALVAAHRAHAENDPDLLFAAARAKVLRRLPQEAVPLVREAMRRQPADNLRQLYYSQFAESLAEMDLGMQAYQEAPDRTAVFPTIAAVLVRRKKPQDLLDLVNAHRREFPQDPWGHFYLGEWRLLHSEGMDPAQQRQEAHLAAEPFVQAYRGCQRWNQYRIRTTWARAVVKSGQSVIAYRQAFLHPQKRSFEALGQACIDAHDADQLAALLAAHRQNVKDDDLGEWDVELHWLKRDALGTLALLNRHRDRLLTLQGFRWKMHDYRVRALIRLKRFDQALHEVGSEPKYSIGTATVLIHATRGDIDATLQELAKHQRHPDVLASYYADADLGPILRSEAFAKVRERFPEPKPEELEDRD